MQKCNKKSTEAVAPKLHSTSADDASPTPLSARKQRSARRLQEFQEKKRAALLAEKVATGMDTNVAEAAVRREEAKRLERLKADKAAPMEDASIEGHSGGEQPEQTRDEAAGPKRARASESPEAG